MVFLKVLGQEINKIFEIQPKDKVNLISIRKVMYALHKKKDWLSSIN